ncbi:MAG: hypothetical protein ABI625_05365 [bacterium]
MNEFANALGDAHAARAKQWIDRLPMEGWRAVALIAFIHLVVALLAFDPTPQAGGDNAAYRALAEALVAGRGYVRLWEPSHAMETLYPPVFPLLLAAPIKLGLRSFAALQLLMVVFSTAGVGAMYVWLRRTLPGATAFACGVIIALSPGLLDLSHALLSDIPFAALSALALGAFAAVSDDTTRRARNVAWLAVGIGATVLAHFTRSAGLPLLLAALLWLAWQRRYVAGALLVAVVAPLALAWSARARSTGTANYADYLRFIDPYQPELGRVDGVALMGRIFDNGARYVTRHLPNLLVGTGGGFAALAGVIVFGLAIVGFSTRVRRPSVAELWIVLYSGVLLLWPQTWSGERLLLPIYPLLLAYAALALPLVRERLPRPAILAAFALAALSLIVSDVQRVARGLGCTAAYRKGNLHPCVERDWADYFLVAQALRDRLPAGSVVISRKPTILYAESGYPSLVFPLSTARDTLFTEARRIGARYVMVDGSQLTSMYVYDVLRQHPSRFCSLPAFRRDLASLFRIEPERALSAAPRDTNAIVDCTPGGER